MIWLQKILFAIRDVMTTKRIPVAGTLQIDDDGWLVTAPGVITRMAHRSWYDWDERLKTISGKPVGMVWHFTDTKPGTAATMARARLVPRTKTDRDASWHITIETDGTIWQMVPFMRGAWHAGKGKSYVGSGVARPVSPNAALVGVEVVGFGKSYTDAQVKSAGVLVAALAERYGWDSRACSHEHRDFDPVRRDDMGPPWTDKHLPTVLQAAGFLISGQSHP